MRFMRGAIMLAPMLVLVQCQQETSTAPATETRAEAAPVQAVATPSPVERGKYLTMVGGCNDCHTPKLFGPKGPEADMSRELSGHPAGDALPAVPKNLLGPNGWGALTNNHLTAWAGPWGVSFAMNLTPDKVTGLGTWTPEMFIGAMRTGRHQGAGRPILPPMPWNWYANLTDDDLKAIFAYLQSLPAVNNPVPDPLPPDRMPQ